MLRFSALFASTAVCAGIAGVALANDSMAELGAGGLILVHSNVVAMESEDLFISQEAVRVDYVFRNRSDKTVESLVAFPMPDIAGDPYANVAIPEPSADNFLGFAATADGKPLSPQLEQKAFALEIDVSEDLKRNGIPLFPYAEGMEAALDRLPAATKADWLSRGILIVDTYDDDGTGMKDHLTPIWRLKSTYWWRMAFPAGEPVRVQHSYRPSVGGSVGLAFIEDGKPGGEAHAQYREKYCLDAAFDRAVQKAIDRTPEGEIPFTETWLSYILTTGGNWATNIEKFHLTIDKGDPNALVSFCGEGVKKTGPTTFEIRTENFYPERDLHILILKRPEAAQ
ncbi:MAG: DUF4424 domain-containing protein [Mesorhizobium sp.]|nr:DUF4424 domain-containing protein [Mesorhizobium sp.]